MKYVILVFIFLSTVVFPTYSSASMTEELAWKSLTVDCGEHRTAGKISLAAKMKGRSIVALDVTAYGRTHSLEKTDLDKLVPFSINDFKYTIFMVSKRPTAPTQVRFVFIHRDREDSAEWQEASIEVHEHSGVSVQKSAKRSVSP